jgi:hypothetical protein
VVETCSYTYNFCNDWRRPVKSQRYSGKYTYMYIRILVYIYIYILSRIPRMGGSVTNNTTWFGLDTGFIHYGDYNDTIQLLATDTTHS